MTGRHAACERCGARLRVVRLWPRPGEVDELVDCPNRDCPSNHPTGPIPIVGDHHRDRAEAEVESIKRELRERLNRGEIN